MVRINVHFRIEEELKHQIDDLVAESMKRREKISQSDIVEQALREFLTKGNTGE